MIYREPIKIEDWMGKSMCYDIDSEGSDLSSLSGFTEICYSQKNHHEHAKQFHPTGLLLKAQSTGESNSSPQQELYSLQSPLETGHLTTFQLQEGCEEKATKEKSQKKGNRK